MQSDALYQDPELAQFYDLENGWADDTRYCLASARGASSVLDLGCGTGLLAAALAAEGREVVGVDPAAAMLAIARKRPGGAGVRWVEADARDLRLRRHFDLIVLTGHAFQVFLSDQDQTALCRTIAAHLAPEGRFIFDSRNPIREEWRQWTPELSQRSFPHPDLGRIEAWNDVTQDEATGIVAYGTHYRTADGQVRSARSAIRFTTREAIAARISDAGLEVHRWLGDWTGADNSQSAPEIITIGGLSRSR